MASFIHSIHPCLLNIIIIIGEPSTEADPVVDILSYPYNYRGWQLLHLASWQARMTRGDDFRNNLQSLCTSHLFLLAVAPNARPRYPINMQIKSESVYKLRGVSCSAPDNPLIPHQQNDSWSSDVGAFTGILVSHIWWNNPTWLGLLNFEWPFRW